MHMQHLLVTTSLLLPVFTFAQQHVKSGLGAFAGSTDIGATRAGSTVYNASSKEYRVTGGGADIWGLVDDFHLTWVQVSRDGSLTADIRFPAGSPEPLRKAVLMFRQSLDPGSAYADAAIHGDGDINLQFRAVADARRTTPFQLSMARPVFVSSAGVMSLRPLQESQGRPLCPDRQ